MGAFDLVPYASRTGTRSTLDKLALYGWRLLVNATGVHNNHGFRYCIDNGAWTAYQARTAWREDLYVDVVRKLGKWADFVVLPDIVEGGSASLSLSLKWLKWTAEHTSKVLIPVQDGMTALTVLPYLRDCVGIFVGGSTEFKLSTMTQWGALAWAHGTLAHVGRVNSIKRIALCAQAAVISFDGTCATKFPKHIPMLSRAVRDHKTLRDTRIIDDWRES